MLCLTRTNIIMKKIQFISSEDAANLLADNNMCALEGFIGTGVAEEIYLKIEERFIKTGYPRNLSLIYAAGQGDLLDKGLNHFGYEGLVKRVIAGHWGMAPKLCKLAIENKLEAYNLPQGVITHIFRDIGAGKPGTISHVGLGTYIDPDIDGGKMNIITKKDIVHKMQINNRDYLFYDSHKIDWAILRGTSSDENGNISFEKEALTIEALAIAIAARNSGGKTIVQVERKVKNKSIDPKLVQIPGIFVDYVVIASDKKNHMQTFSEQFNESLISPIALKNKIKIDLPLDERKVIARRAAMCLNRNINILNFGIGMPECIALILSEEKIAHHYKPTVEPGSIGGIPLGGLSFGCSLNPEAIIDQPYQFDFYDGGGIDMAFLGLAQTDRYGNINVSKFGSKFAGCGGFIDITQNAKEVVFCGTFTADGLEVEIKNGYLKILREGKYNKFLQNVEQITFSGNLARDEGKSVKYITERAVFQLTTNGFELIEIAPGIDLEKDILNHMDFKPKISDTLTLMNSKIFCSELMNLEI